MQSHSELVVLVGLWLLVVGLGWRLKPLRALCLRLLRLARATQTTPAADRKPFTGRAYVIDGDTLSVCKTRIRMYGMDAPEMSQRGGAASKSHLIRCAGGKQVRVVPVAIDIYGRTVARVWLGDVDLSEKMVRDGFACADSHWNQDYNSAELHARKAQRGLWSGNPGFGITSP